MNEIKNAIFDSRDFKELFFLLKKRDQILLLLFLWSFPIGGLVNFIFHYLAGESRPLPHLVLPLLLATALIFVRRWHPYFYKLFRFLPFAWMVFLALAYYRTGHTWTSFLWGIYMTVSVLAIVAAVPAISWYRLANTKENGAE